MTRSEKRSLKQLRARLTDLAARFGGKFYWRNGVIRHAVYAPTKGWKERRWERYDVPGFAGSIDAAHLDAHYGVGRDGARNRGERNVDSLL